MKSITFTRHAKKRVAERFGGFGIKNAITLLDSAEKVYEANGTVHYSSKAYTFIVKESDNNIKVLTFFKHL